MVTHIFSECLNRVKHPVHSPGKSLSNPPPDPNHWLHIQVIASACLDRKYKKTVEDIAAQVHQFYAHVSNMLR